MKHILYLLSFVLCIISCDSSNHKTKEVADFVPNNSVYVIRANSLETLESDIKNNDIINRLSKANFLDSITKKLHQFDSLKIKDDVVICISNTNDISFITRLSKDFVLGNGSQKLSSNLHQIILDSIAVVSTSKKIIDKIKSETIYRNNGFTKLYKTFNRSPLTVFINQNITSKSSESLFRNDTFRLNNFSDWMVLDADLHQDQIMLNGVSVITDSLPKLLSAFKNTSAKHNKTADFAPQNVDGFISLTFDNFQTFHNNLRVYNNQKIDSTQLKLFKNTPEIGLIFKDNAIAIAVQTLDIIEAKDALLDQHSIANTFRQTAIFNYSKTNFFNTTLHPFVSATIDRYTILDDAIVFSNNEDFLNDIIAKKQNKQTLSNSETFQESIKHLSSQSSMLIVANTVNFKTYLAQLLSKDLEENINNLNLDNYPFSAIQFIQDNGFLHTNAIINKNQPKAVENSVNEQFSIVLDQPILSEVQIVKNHLNNQKEIVVQDIKNNLYLISNKGNVLWKKQINGNILGRIEQIDMYKNGRLQLAFATQNRVYVLDRNGKDVSPFPLKFNDNITQPLSVFDYDNKKNYRLLVTQGKNTLMYDHKGQRVFGFKFKGAKSSISSQPRHFRIGSKDYIIFSAGNNLEILNRTGQSRINVKQNFNFSDNDIYLYKNKFSFTNTKGELIQIDQNGRLAKQNLMLTNNHYITATNKTLATLAGNKLSIKSKTIDLDFGQYTKPEIFYLRDKIYVATTDLQSQKAYIFDSQAKLINNFPVYGTSKLQLDNIDGDKNLEFIVKGDSNNIILYQIN